MLEGLDMDVEDEHIHELFKVSVKTIEVAFSEEYFVSGMWENCRNKMDLRQEYGKKSTPLE